MKNESCSAIAVAALLAAFPAAAQEGPLRSVTFHGCVQATGDPSQFQLSVPGRFPDPDRGIPAGEPIPPVSGIGPEPRPHPGTIPPRFPPDEPGRPAGRYDTPTMVHRTYQLQNVSADVLAALVGAHVEVDGRIQVEGFPSGDLPESPGDAAAPPAPPAPTLYVTEITKRSDVCSPSVINDAR